MVVRQGEMKDVQQLLDIYNYEVVNGVATLDLNEKTLEEWELWLEEHLTGSYKIIVGEESGRICGYATLSAYRKKEAYASTVELSIYVSPHCRRQGVASLLMKEIIDLAKADERIHVVVSVITSGNEASERLHKKFGFAHAGTIHQVGWKQGRYLDIDNFELIL